MPLPRGSDGGEEVRSQFVFHTLMCEYVSAGSGGGAQQGEGCPYMGVVMEHKGFGSWAHHMAGALTAAFAANKTMLPKFPYDYFFHEG